MVEIRPFRGVRYNPAKVDTAKAFCPPYDIISSQQQDDLYRRSEYNFVRVEYNKELPGDTLQNSRYSRAASNLEEWLNQGILQYEPAPALYLHEHSFTLQGRHLKRQNLLVLVRLEEWDTMQVRPHENIIPRAQSDRLNMLRACRANTSPVLAMYEDPARVIFNLINAEEKKEPVIDIPGTDGERHRVWAVMKQEVTVKIQKELALRPLYIADGHHRYDSALTYRREQAAAGRGGGEGPNYVLMSLIDMADPGLIILPPHRVVRGIPRATLEGLKKELGHYFEIEDLPVDGENAWSRVDALLCGIKPELQKIRLAVFGLEKDTVQVLTLKDHKTAGSLMPGVHSDLYKRLDVSLVDHIILEKIVGYNKDQDSIALDYVDNRPEAVRRVKEGEFQLVFILNPVKPELIKSIADAGDRMPRKSTYFYPKAPAGLVFYKW